MNILVTDPYDRALSGNLTDEVQASGLNVTPIDLGTDPDATVRYRLGFVPCVARIYQGTAVYLVKDTSKVATFDADADAVVEALTGG